MQQEGTDGGEQAWVGVPTSAVVVRRTTRTRRSHASRSRAGICACLLGTHALRNGETVCTLSNFIGPNAVHKRICCTCSFR